MTLRGDRREILERSLIFSSLDDSERAELAGLASESSYQPGQYIFAEGDPPERLCVVVAGRIKIVKHSTQGKETIISFFQPGEMFGEVAVFENKPYPASAQAVTATTILSVRRDAFVSFMARRPELAVKIIGVLGGRLREAQSRIRDIAGERVEQRLARTLLMLSAKLGKELPFTRQEIADVAGTTMETASRVIGRMGDAGIVQSGRGKTEVLDPAKLRLLAEGRLDI